MADTSAASPEFPSGRFCAILCDPPWTFRTCSSRGKGRSAEAHYDTMDLAAIKRLPVADWAAPNCVLLLWVTSGYWTRSNVELCLLATRGKPHRLSAAVRQLITAPRREHSRKPDEAYGLIERLLAGPYLELFSSSTAPHRIGWTKWSGKDRAPARHWKSDSYSGAEETPR
jgi:N6-adenosine-specific RNA methylase IME4